jgi:hypothetical protein
MLAVADLKGACKCGRERLKKEPRRVAWYPGSEQRAKAFMAAMPGVEELGVVMEDSQHAPSSYIPWLFQAGLSPDKVCRAAPAQPRNWW